MNQQPRYLGIGFKIGAMVCVLVIATSSAVGFATYWRFNRALVHRELEEVGTLAGVASTRFLAAVNTVRADALVLAGIPVLHGIVRAHEAGGVDPVDGWSDERLRERLATVFVAMMQAKPDYSKISFIGVADGGKELVSVQRGADHSIHVARPDELQAKGQRPYMQRALNTPRDQVYLSDIELEFDRDTILVPHAPVIRAAVPIYTSTGERFGIVIVNRRVASLFDEFKRKLQLGQAFYVTNDRGDFLLHPDPAKTFAFEFGLQHRIQDEFPNIRPAFTGLIGQNNSVVENTADGERLALGLYKAGFDPDSPQRFFAFGLSAPYGNVVADSNHARNLSLIVALGVLLPALTVGFALSRSMTKPLQRIVTAVDEFGRGETNVSLPVDASDEAGVVARSLAHMMEQVRDRTAKLEAEAAEREQAQQKLLAANREIARTAADIAGFNARLARSNEELKQFAYVASHDLQEPLRKVTSFCQMLREEYGDQLDENASQYITYAVDGALRMKTLVTDLLTYSRVETQGKPLTPTDGDRALAEAIDNLEFGIQEAGATVECQPLPAINADYAQLVRLFQNLIGNAIKYRSEKQPRIDIWAEDRGDEWVFHVRDNGLGIEPQYHERIFVIFQRLHSREAYSGTGIGLAVCKRTVERFGGRICVESELGRGSDFCFAVPKLPCVLSPEQSQGNENESEIDSRLVHAD